MKRFCTVLIIFLSINLSGQKFSFLPEVGLLRTQMDGDKLQGYHKTGFLVGIGTHYALSNSVNLAVKTSFYSHGSARKDRFQDKLDEGIQLEMGLSTIGLEVSAMYQPEGKSIFLGAGLVNHTILDYDYKVIDNVISGPPRILEPSAVSRSFNSIKLYVGWRFNRSYRFTIAYEKSFSDILVDDFFNLNRLLPYHLAFSLSYEFNPQKEKRNQKAKKRRVRT